MLKAVLMVVGAVLLLAGLLFAGQGAGVINWPASSFMIEQRSWVVRGAVLAIAGVGLLWVGWKR